MPDSTHRRKNYLINKKFQLKYTFAIVAMLLVVMLVSGVGLYVGMWTSIIENFSKFRVSENLETVKRLTAYEQARYEKGDVRLEKIFREAELLSAREREILYDALRSVNRSLVPKVLILALLIFLGGIFVSHKIAGPMYRFEKSAEAVRNGDLRVNFNVRKDDEMKGAATTLEEMVESLRKDIEKMKKLADEGKTGEIKAILSKYKT